MKRILIPVDGSAKSIEAVKAAVAGGRGSVDRIDLLHVQPRLPRDISRFVSRRDRENWRADNARRALEPARQLVESSGIACRTHARLGAIAMVVEDTARRLCTTEIVLGATKRGLLGRLLRNSVSTRLLEKASVPVRVIPAAPTPYLERLALPLGAGMALLALAAED
jgi:nucleotide-binding universal stress UspA family protein